MKILKTVQKVPGGMMVIPLLLGVILNTVCPSLLQAGGYVTALWSSGGANTAIAIFLFCVGAQIQLRQGGQILKRGFVLLFAKFLAGAVLGWVIGAIFGTSNTTTYVESAAGIGAGGRTGLTSVIVALCFAISAFLATFVSAIPFAATAPALVVVGIMMMSAFKEIQWDDFDEAVPAFFAGIFMALCYSISYGIAAGFIFYCITKICKKKVKEIHPILWIATALFILNFVLLAII